MVTQGTVANQDASALFEPALRALADLDALVVVATGHDGPPLHDVPSNARVGGYLPFDLLLPRTDVLVTNGGYGGALLSLAYGVPMVVAGVTEDKPEVAGRVAWSGCGINLSTAHPDEEAVRSAVATVLAEPSYARAAQRLQAEIASADAFEAFTAQVDELVGAGRPPARV